MGYTRKATVQFFMKQYDKAMETYQALLSKEPENAEAQDGVRRCVDAINRGNRGEMTEEEMKERQAKAMAEPEIQGILTDPVMRWCSAAAFGLSWKSCSTWRITGSVRMPWISGSAIALAWRSFISSSVISPRLPRLMASTHRRTPS